MKIVLATGNEGKRKELVTGMRALKAVEWKTLNDFEAVVEPEETGTTFEVNALLKAEQYAKILGLPCIAEDSGIILDAFPEKFGVNTKREIDAKTDIDWLRIFLELLEDEENRGATFYSSMAFFDPKTGTSHVVLESVKGEIAEFPMAPVEKGVPISAVFVPDGAETVFSGMGSREKNTFSHRGKACTAMQLFLKEHIEG
jgi:XTP/dITP diphosphohydrolase